MYGISQLVEKVWTDRLQWHVMQDSFGHVQGDPERVRPSWARQLNALLSVSESDYRWVAMGDQ